MKTAKKKPKGITVKTLKRPRPRFVDATFERRTSAARRQRSAPVVLPGENAAKAASPDDVRRAASVLVAAAYRLHQNVDGTTMAPPFDAFGKGRAVRLSVGVNVEADGTASVKLSGEVDGRKFEV